jgi:hypothetical protein
LFTSKYSSSSSSSIKPSQKSVLGCIGKWRGVQQKRVVNGLLERKSLESAKLGLNSCVFP